MGSIGLKNIVTENFFITNCDTLLRCDYFIVASHLKINQL